MRPYRDATDQEAMRRKATNMWGRLRADSVLVACMGNHWTPGAWNRVADMVVATQKAGIDCGLTELQDRCLNPHDSLGTMRNEAIMMTQVEGFEWLLYLDNDVLPEPDMLLRLLKFQLPIIAPFVAEPGVGRPLHGPPQQANTGIKPIKWCVLSALLMHSNVFHSTGPHFWLDAIGADEGVHFQTLWYYGHRLWMDTTTLLQVASRPNYPLAARNLPLAERVQQAEGKLERMRQRPDRRPIDPGSPLIVNGDYMPFGNVAQPAPVQQVPATITPAKTEEVTA